MRLHWTKTHDTGVGMDGYPAWACCHTAGGNVLVICLCARLCVDLKKAVAKRVLQNCDQHIHLDAIVVPHHTSTLAIVSNPAAAGRVCAALLPIQPPAFELQTETDKHNMARC